MNEQYEELIIAAKKSYSARLDLLSVCARLENTPDRDLSHEALRAVTELNNRLVERVETYT